MGFIFLIWLIVLSEEKIYKKYKVLKLVLFEINYIYGNIM